MVSIYAALIETVKPLTATLPALFAKSSMFWTSVLYMLTNKQVKSRLFKNSELTKDTSIKMSKS